MVTNPAVHQLNNIEVQGGDSDFALVNIAGSTDDVLLEYDDSAGQWSFAGVVSGSDLADGSVTVEELAAALGTDSNNPVSGTTYFENLDSGSVSTDELFNKSDFDRGRPKQGLDNTHTVRESETLAGNSSTTLHSISGSGVLRNWWTALSGAGAAISDAWWEIVVDGDTANPIRGDFANVGLRIRNQDPSVDPHQFTYDIGHVKGEHLYDSSVNSNAFAGCNFMFPIPFESSLEITLHNDRSNSFTYFSIPYHEELSVDEVPEWRLRSDSQLIQPDGFVTVPAGDSVDYFDIPAGTSGFLAGLFFICDNASSSTRINIEDDIDTHINRDATPQRKSTGSEDFMYFTWGNFWDSFTEWGTSAAGINAVDESPHVTTWGADFVEHEGGIHFNDGCYVRRQHEASAPADGNYAWAGFWYEDVS